MNSKSFSLISVLTLSSISYNVFSQKKGFEGLAYAKTSLESIIKQYGATIPDSSKTYKDYYLPISKKYNAAKASYSAFLGAMKDCILNSNTEKKIKKCLQSRTLNIENNLDTLRSLFDNAYLEYYLKHQIKTQGEIITKNNGAITADTIKALMGALIDAGIKIWDEFQKRNKQFKDDYLANIQNKDYILSDFDDLIKQVNKK
jgi:hypothetical protein